MASINGITLKARTDFRGHEGEPCSQGNLYLGNKKIGFWSQSSYGGPDEVRLEPGLSEEKLNDKIRELNKGKSEALGGYKLDLLMEDLLNLQNAEKIYKQSLKKGYTALFVVTCEWQDIIYSLMPVHVNGKTSEEIYSALYDKIKEAKKNSGISVDAEDEIALYKTLDDFNIGKKITLAEIRK